MGKEIQRRVRTTKQASPLSIPLDQTTLLVDWSRILSSLRRAHRAKLTKTKKKQLVPVDAPVVVAVPVTDTGKPGARSPLQLRRLLANVKFSGITDHTQSRIDTLIRTFRSFLVDASDTEITSWWKRLHTLLPEPIFFVLYASLKAVL